MTGIHTYSVGMVLTYRQYQTIKEKLYEVGAVSAKENVFKGTERLYSAVYEKKGLKIFMHARAGKLYRLRIQIEPCRVLGEHDPTAVWNPERKTYKEMVKTANRLLKPLKIPLSIHEMKISRCDLTVNLFLKNSTELNEYLRILKKSRSIPRYKRVSFRPDEKKAIDPKTANQHSYCVCCKGASFLVYDKLAQLEMIGRSGNRQGDMYILRLEAELKRAALKQHLGKTAFENNRTLILRAAEKVIPVVNWYVKRLQPSCERYVRFEEAVTAVQEMKCKQKTKERMLYLLRKTSDSDTLDNAIEKMRRKFELSKGQCTGVLKKFERLGISPITLRNNSEFEELSQLLRKISTKNERKSK